MCHEKCRLFVVNRRDLEDLLFVDRDLAYELLWNWVRTLSRRLRATNDKSFVVRDPATKEPVTDAAGKEKTFAGWRDPNFKPAPAATAFPDCWSDAFKKPTPSASAGASGSAGPSASAAPSGSAGGAALTITAQNIAFGTGTLEAAAGQAFSLSFDNEDAGIPHNVDILDPGGQSVFKGEIFDGVATRVYSVPALTAGAYKFQCDVHPNMTGTLTVK